MGAQDKAKTHRRRRRRRYDLDVGEEQEPCIVNLNIHCNYITVESFLSKPSYLNAKDDGDEPSGVLFASVRMLLQSLQQSRAGSAEMRFASEV